MLAADWPIVDNPPKHCYRRHREDVDVEMKFIDTPVWQDHLQHHLCVVADEEVIADLGGTFEDNNVFLYSIRRAVTDDSAFLPSYLPVIGAESRSPWQGASNPTYGPSSALFYCDNHLVFLTGTRAREAIATVLPVPTATSQRVTDSSSAMLLHGPSTVLDCHPFMYTSVGFCPMSGRLVHLIKDSLFRVVDWLLPLSRRSVCFTEQNNIHIVPTLQTHS